MDFSEGLEVFVIFFLNLYLDGFWWMFLVVVNVVVCIRLLFFSNFKSGPCEDPMPEAEVKWNTVGWK